MLNLITDKHTRPHLTQGSCAKMGATSKSGKASRRLIAGIPAFLILLTFTFHSPLLSANELVDKSPFLPPNHNVKPAEPVKPEVQPEGPISNQIEFRGIVQMDGKYQFSIFNKKDQKGYWLTEDDAAKSGIVVRDFDADSSSVVVNMNGRSERITLADASDSPLPVPQSKPVTPQTASPGLPPELNNRNQVGNNSNDRRTIPRRRVILPKKTN